jgi:hypothetical protein
VTDADWGSWLGSDDQPHFDNLLALLRRPFAAYGARLDRLAASRPVIFHCQLVGDQ